MRSADGENKKPPARITVALESKMLASREEAAQTLSISPGALDYLIATRRLAIRRIGGRVLIPVSEFGNMRGPTIQSGSRLGPFRNGRGWVDDFSLLDEETRLRLQCALGIINGCN